MEKARSDQDRYVGMWVTADGDIHHELLPGGRYDEARGKRKHAYQGRYVLTGDHIDYVDDTGFTADGDFRDGILYHAGMVLHRAHAPRTREPYPLARVHRLLEPGPVVLVSTSHQGRNNLMTNGFNMPVQHDPPRLGLVVGPWDHSFAALQATRECVIAIPSVELAERVVDVGNVSGRTVDKWKRFHFTPVPAAAVSAPLVLECFANIECKVIDDRLVDAYGLWLLEPVRAWVDQSRRGLGEFHHRGDGTFSVNGATVDLRSRMTKWPELVD